MEPPALVGSPAGQQSGGREPGHILAELSAALENPDIKALEWAEDGRGVIIHATLYEEELGRYKELFPALTDLGSVPVLQAWLLAHGFRLEEAQTNPPALVLQHADFQRVNPTAVELGTPGGNAGPSAKQQKKRKKRRRSSLQPCRKVTSWDALGRLPRLRPLYQYINYDMPELMCPSEEEGETLGLAETATGPELEGELQQAFDAQGHLPLTNWLSQGLRTHLTDSPFAASLMHNPQETWASSALELPAPALDDKPMQVDLEKPLSCTAYLVSPFFP
ncbi:uncharacterized protein C16orf86 homolog [Oxyura jamaicensis]|uniref:uncharacterized protein C16orf86 homolog n=1 Tax=Oxyura jamaicensis TaxID=8884 RepID=UPI0015A50FF6|nr:uncharacterized protein C16orf86 homolog [Oxyura jamaicensis]